SADCLLNPAATQGVRFVERLCFFEPRGDQWTQVFWQCVRDSVDHVVTHEVTSVEQVDNLWWVNQHAWLVDIVRSDFTDRPLVITPGELETHIRSFTNEFGHLGTCRVVQTVKPDLAGVVGVWVLAKC